MLRRIIESSTILATTAGLFAFFSTLIEFIHTVDFIAANIVWVKELLLVAALIISGFVGHAVAQPRRERK